MGSSVRLALVHDWLNQLGGAEDVLEALVACYPSAPVFTSIYWRDRMPPTYQEWDIRTTWLDRAPGIHRHHRPYLPLYALAFSGLDVSGFDVVLSNKSGFCHGVSAGPALHICYCLSPTRYVWDLDAYMAGEALAPTAKAALRLMVGFLRRWDFRAAQHVSHFIAISQAVRDRIRATYARESTVIYPPVDTAPFAEAGLPLGPSRGSSGGYYLIVSRLVAYRRLDQAIEAFNRLDSRLVIAGEGPDRDRLESMAGPNVTLLGRVSDEDLPGLFARCRAYVVPGEEDFGIAPVQAQAAGRPVIALAKGGALDTIVDGATGCLYNGPSADALADIVDRFDPDEYDPAACQRNAARFSAGVFGDRITTYVRAALCGNIPRASQPHPASRDAGRGQGV